MEGCRLFQIFCSLNLIAVIYCGVTEDTGNDVSYDSDGFIIENADLYEYSLLAEIQDAMHQLKFDGIHEEKMFELSEHLAQNSSKCMADLSYAFANKQNFWAMKMFDSFGKPESGILRGNAMWLGDYEECLGVRASHPNSTTVGNFRGKYCFAKVSLEIKLLNQNLTISTAVCIPDSCSAEEIQENLPQLLRNLPDTFGIKSALEKSTLQCKPVERRLNSAAKWVIALLTFFFTLSVIGSSITAVKHFQKIIENFEKPLSVGLFVNSSHIIGDQNDVVMEKDGDHDLQFQAKLPEGRTEDIKHKLESFLTCFCVFTNGSKLLNTDTSEGELLCIHGIRFLSMCWVIFGHSYLFGITQMKNMGAILDYINTFLSEIIFQAFYSVDSFFVLSGFLLGYLVMNEMSKSNGRIAWPMFYIHRYVRLTPFYMLLLAFSATVYQYIGSGPYWNGEDVDPNCKTGWWRNLLYINNFIDQDKECMVWAWYLANDMQFFVISPLFLITLWRWPKIGFSLIGVFMVACWLSNFFITYHFDLMAGSINISQAKTAPMSKFLDFMNYIYIKPYNRISPYLIGIVTGYFLHKRKQSNQPRHSLLFLCFGWSMSVGIGLICVFVLYKQDPSLIGNCFYNAFNRTAFALSLAWIIYACLIGEGGFVNRLLSYKAFIPLSRLTYAAYLIHPMVMSGYFNSLKTSIQFNHPTIVFLFFAFLVATYLVSLPVALVLESPVVALEKWIRKSFAKQRKTETVN